MVIYPAIDLREGRVVRLAQGDFERETGYDSDPLAVAESFVQSGAEWLHVVDLDAARGAGDNRGAIGELAARAGVPIQVGGGVRDTSLLSLGVERLVIGSLLLKDRPAAARLVSEAPGRVAFGLDHRDGELKVSGWTVDSGHSLRDVLEWEEISQAAALIVTDISTDGMLTGPNLSVLEDTMRRSPVPVICSGGVAGVEDVVACRDSGAAGLIIGRAFYEHRLTLEEAIGAGR